MSGKITIGNTNAAILRGDDDVRDWTDEELRRGQRRNKNGGWSGRPPKIVPKVVHDELVRRQYDAAAEILRDSLVDAVQLFADIVRDTAADPAVRLKAASIILDRVAGRQALNIRVESKFDAAVAHAIVSLPAEMIDAQAWEADEG